MPVISAIEPQRRHGRYNVFVDGEFVIGLAEAVIVRLGLRTGMPLDPSRLAQVGRAEELQRAVDASARLLEVRPRSTQELADRLKQKGYDCAVVEDAVARLAELGFLDDASFAKQWIESRLRSHAAGARKLRSELALKGVDRSVIDSALENVSRDDDLAVAEAIVAKKLPDPSPDPDERRKQLNRLVAQLQRRGLSWETVKAATAPIRALSGSDGDDE